MRYVAIAVVVLACAAQAAAKDLVKGGPAAVLLGANFAADARLVRACQELAALLGAEAATGFLGAPMRGPNARGAADLAPRLVHGDPLAARPEVVCSFGCSTPIVVPGGKAIVATSGALPDDPSVEVVLPLAHPYETDGHWTNLEGTVQRLQRAGTPAREVRMDHVLLRELVAAATAVPAGGRR